MDYGYVLEIRMKHFIGNENIQKISEYFKS